MSQLDRVFDPFDPNLPKDPYRVYRHFRQHDPVHWGKPSTPEFNGGWYLFCHVDIKKVLSSDAFSVDRSRRQHNIPRQPPTPDETTFWRWIGQSISFRDPPDHTRLRSVVRDIFSPAGVRKLAPMIRHTVDRKLQGLGGRSQFDVAADFAEGLPMEILAALMGEEISAAAEFRDIIGRISGALDLRSSADVYQDARLATEKLVVMLEALFVSRRKSTGSDLISVMQSAVSDGKLSHEEAVSMVIFILLAGSGSSTHGILGAIHTIMSNPSQCETYLADSENDRAVIDETFRFSAPVQMVPRLAIEDFTVGERVIRKGDDVTLVLASANRDEAIYRDPDTFDISRPTGQHSAFGWGTHFCLGAVLIRLETQIAVRRFFECLPGVGFSDKPVKWTELVAFRGLSRFPVSVNR